MAKANKGKGGGLTPEDAALWDLATQGDRRFPGKEIAEPENPETEEPALEIPDIPQKKLPAKPPAKAVHEAPPLREGGAAGVDGNTLERLRKGKLPIEGKLDLHGHTREEAHAALRSFLGSAQSAGKRCVLVVTGRGLEEGMARGVIRREFPHWLNLPENRARVLAFAKARPEHGGEGAFYVLLKKGVVSARPMY